MPYDKSLYSNLQQEGKIASLTLKNRVAMTAMGLFIAAPGGGANDDIIAFYEARAKGGVGLIITEVTRVTDGAGISQPCQLAARNAADILPLQKLTDIVHKYDCKVFPQLQHPGREASRFICGEQPVAASAIANTENGQLPRELSTDECEALIDKFVNSARIAQMAGADGVELHAAHGYLLAGFLSPATNRRTDRFGGSFENRMRFVTDIIAGIRQVCGAFPISVRINAVEALPGGVDIQMAQKIALALQKAGADCINVSCFDERCLETGSFPEGSKRSLTQAIKDAVSIPIIGVSNIKEPETAEALLGAGVCDFAGVARAHLADADWCAKAFAGRQKEIRRCIGCLACFGEIYRCNRLKCAVNPVAARELEYRNPVQDGAGRRVAVVGGGPAGIEAALVLKERNYSPIILEAGEKLGGALNVADKGMGKEKITRYLDSLVIQVEKAGIEVRLNTCANAKLVRQINPAGVFVACGAEPLVPPIPGLNKRDRVATAEDVLLGKALPVGKVVLIGSGMTGLEAAELLADAGCSLTLVEMQQQLGPGILPMVMQDTLGRIMPCRPKIFIGHKLEEATADGVELTRCADGERVFVQADWIVLAMGVRPRKAVADNFRKAFPSARIIGDATKGGRILEATQDAHGKAFVFSPA